jgi:hypothetical protein
MPVLFTCRYRQIMLLLLLLELFFGVDMYWGLSDDDMLGVLWHHLYKFLYICCDSLVMMLSSKVRPCFLFDHFKWRRKNHTCCNFPLHKQGLSCMVCTACLVHIVKHSVIMVFYIRWTSLFRIIASVMLIWTKCCLLLIGPRAPTNYGRRTTCSFHVIPDAGRENQ